MKFVKIISAVLFFSFSGNFHNQLFAQEPTKSAGSSTQTLNADEYLENGDFRAKITRGANGRVHLIIYKASDNAVVRTVSVGYTKGDSPMKSMGFDTQDKNDIKLITNQEDAAAGINSNSITIDSRSRGNLANFKVLNTSVETTDSAYFKLESDGRCIIYSARARTRRRGRVAWK